MKTKILLCLTTALLTACGSNFVVHTPKPKYKVTEEEMKAFILEANNKEQCIHPELAGLTFDEAEKKVYSRISYAERVVWDKKIIGETLNEVVGGEKARIIMQDPHSSNYFWNVMHKKLNHQNAQVDKARCETFKKEWNNDLKMVKNEIERLEKEELARRRQAEKEELARRQQAEKEALARRQQAEREERARQAFYATPEGQAYLAQQRILAQQQAMLAQQQAMQNAMIAQREAELEAQRRQEQWQSLQNSMSALNNTLNNNVQQINQMNQYNQMQQMNRSLNNINNTLQNMGNSSVIRWNNVY